jgi:acetyl-CoA C-acetyltransferase
MGGIDPHQPVLVGAAQLVRGSGEPLDMMEEVARAAMLDAGAELRVDSVAVVDSVSWLVGDPGALLAKRLKLEPRETVRTGLGGSAPQALVNDLAGRIADGSLDCAVIAGAEALATLMPYVKSGEKPPWTEDPGGEATRVLDRGNGGGSSSPEEAAGLIAPIFFYPLLEHAVRRAARRTRGEHLHAIASLWSRFSRVAAENEHAWSPQARATGEIATPSNGNRLVSDPYTKLLNANITVDMASALVLCSAGTAEAAGVPRDRWVFVHAGAQANDHWHVSEREELHRSPAIAACGKAALGHAGVGIDEVEHVDLYSCFPSAVQIGAFALGIDLRERTPTLTGGLTFAGGPGNNYATHAIAALVPRLREDPDAYGLTTALGWYVTKHALGVYSGRPPERTYRTFDVQEEVDRQPRRAVAEGYSGPATVESYTALYERDGAPGMGIVAARLPDGRRALAKTHDASELAELLGDDDPLGRAVEMRAPDAFVLS